LGYHELNKAINWRLKKDLNNFLQKHKNNRILLITFGIMTNPEPEKKTKIIIDKITTKNLEPKIFELVNNTSFKKKAEKVASQMEKEDFREELYNAIVE
jgi:hypothetical protein